MPNEKKSPKKSAKKSAEKPLRRTLFNQKLADLICHRVATNVEGLEKLCKKYDDMPCKTAIYEWRILYPEFGRCFAEAKRQQAEIIAESLLDIAAEKSTYIDQQGNERYDPGYIMDKRIRMDTMKWIACKLLPKVYGSPQEMDAFSQQNESIKNELKEMRRELTKSKKRDF